MANEPIIKTFNAADIEKYHRGQLSAGEMHALEKAALDDPFLADALEGYAVPQVNIAADIAELKSRLAAKTEQTKVVPLAPAGKSPVRWFRVAAMIVLVAGAGFLAYRLAFSDKRPEIAQNPAAKRQDNSIGTDQPLIIPQTDSILSPADRSTTRIATGNGSDTTPGNTAGKLETADYDQQSGATTVTTLPPIAAEEKMIINDAVPYHKVPLAKPGTKDLGAGYYRDTTVTVNGYADLKKKKELPPGTIKYERTQNATASSIQPRRTNVFRGRVTDAHNNALPFANITNTADNVGTYTDAKGNFVLTSPDSVLNVQVRSIGFENNVVQLGNTVAPNQVTLQDDKSLGEVVISNRQLNMNSNRSRNNTMVLEEPEPVDGWVNYDTYLANNLVMPETFRSKQTNGGEVQLSFEVNKEGEPVNITVERSLCDSCDKEAIRLVKEGPKWKRNNRKGRTTVTITF